jgi:hypothetical protein
MNVNDLDAILIGDPVEAMEAAKRLVKQNDATDVTTLLTIATCKTMRLWSRIAAIWTLGFIDEDAVSVAALRRIQQDQSEDVRIREHAAEALDDRLS